MVNNAVGIMPKHAGGKTIRLDEDMVDDEKAVVIPVSTLGNSIVSSNGDERRKQSMIILMSGQSLLISSDMVTGTIYKLTSRKH